MGCEKRKYPSRREAEKAMYRQWRRPRRGKMPVRVYPCPHCKHWHTTSQERKAG